MAEEAVKRAGQFQDAKGAAPQKGCDFPFRDQRDGSVESGNRICKYSYTIRMIIIQRICQNFVGGIHGL